MTRSSLTKYAWLSIAAALVTIALKGLAYYLTSSVGLLSDAVESLVNLVAAVFALAMLIIAARPPDDDHPFGHSKAEYFAGGVEGVLIFVAALSIGVAAVERFLHPRALNQTGLGLLFCGIASLVNLGVALVLLNAGKKNNSITLEADAHHLLTDVWTSAGVIAAVGLVALTGWQTLDPIIALLVAANILWTGFHLIQRSVLGLMDAALPKKEVDLIIQILDRYKAQGINYHALRTRQGGRRRFVSVHILVPDEWSVKRGHELAEKIEAEIRETFSDVIVFTHLEPLNDPVSWEDEPLDR